jgi:predicted nucleotidyltransferase
MELAQEFAKRIYRDFGGFVKAAVYFGSSSRNDQKSGSDIDVLIIIDDVTVELDDQTVRAYRIQVMRHVEIVSRSLHVTSLKLSTFWDLLKSGDPVALNILRDGVAMIDSGFFDPFKALLERGRIRPSDEAVATYALRAQRSLDQARNVHKRGVLELFWALVDMTHAALMAREMIPSSPKQLPQMMRRLHGEGHKLFTAEEIALVERLVELEHMITHDPKTKVTAAEFSSLEKRAAAMIERLKRILPHYTVRD